MPRRAAKKTANAVVNAARGTPLAARYAAPRSPLAARFRTTIRQKDQRDDAALVSAPPRWFPAWRAGPPPGHGFHWFRHAISETPRHLFLNHEQNSRPNGSGNVQFCVVPFCVITTFAVAEPSYVMTSLRDDVTGDCPVICTVADIE